MTHWNYRVIYTLPSDPDESGSYAIHEVHYDEAGKPRAHTAEPASAISYSEDLDGLRWVVGEFSKALDKPVLMMTDFEGVK